MWVEFVIDFHLALRVLSGYSEFPLSTKRIAETPAKAVAWPSLRPNVDETNSKYEVALSNL